MPVLKEVGELVYAGGKQTEGNIELLVVKEVAQSYLTKLWNREEFKEKEENPTSFVHLLSRYFTYIVLAIALATGIYWQFTDPARLWPAVSSVFIIACPCALLLSIVLPMEISCRYWAEIVLPAKCRDHRTFCRHRPGSVR